MNNEEKTGAQEALKSLDDLRRAGLYATALTVAIPDGSDGPVIVRPVDSAIDVDWLSTFEMAVRPVVGARIALTAMDAARAARLACEVASWLGDRGRSVIVVDASVDDPTIEKALAGHGDEGLVDAVLFGVSPSAVARQTPASGVRLVTSGSCPLSAGDIFESEEFGRTVESLAADAAVLVIVPERFLETALPSFETVVAVGRTVDDLATIGRRVAGLRPGARPHPVALVTGAADESVALLPVDAGGSEEVALPPADAGESEEVALPPADADESEEVALPPADAGESEEVPAAAPIADEGDEVPVAAGTGDELDMDDREPDEEEAAATPEPARPAAWSALDEVPARHRRTAPPRFDASEGGVPPERAEDAEPEGPSMTARGRQAPHGAGGPRRDEGVGPGTMRPAVVGASSEKRVSHKRARTVATVVVLLALVPVVALIVWRMRMSEGESWRFWVADGGAGDRATEVAEERPGGPTDGASAVQGAGGETETVADAGDDADQGSITSTGGEEEPVEPLPADDERVTAAGADTERGTLPTAPTRGPGGPHFVLVSSHKSESDAAAESARLAARGYETTVVPAQIPDRGLWHRVGVAGGFPSAAAAGPTLARVKTLGYDGAWIQRISQ